MDEAADRAPRQAAAVLYVLAAPQPGGGLPAYLLYEVGGVGCVIAYSDLTRLVECCGEHQPWLGVEITALMADLQEQNLPGPVVNLALNPALWWTADGPPYQVPVSGSQAGSVLTGSTATKGWFS